MYSVIRFLGFENSVELERVGTSVNDIIPGLFTGPDRVPARFSCSISQMDDWGAHSEAINAILTNLSSVIEKAVASGIEVEIDIAVDPEDYRERWFTEFPLDVSLLQATLDNHVGLLMTIYGPGPSLS